MKLTLEKNAYSFSIVKTETKSLSVQNASPEGSWRLQYSSLFDPSFLRIWVVLQGRGRVLTTSGMLDVVENNAYFLPANSIISTTLNESMEQVYIDFFQDPSQTPINQLYTFKMTADPKDFQLLLELTRSCEPIYNKSDSLSQFMISTTITTILSRFMTNVSESSIILNPAIEYITNHYMQPISITYLANLCDYSPEYFSAKFKSHFGISPQQFIIWQRLTKAKSLLITTHKSIREISEDIGYPDQVHFSKLFTKQTGVSPLKFRNTYRH